MKFLIHKYEIAILGAGAQQVDYPHFLCHSRNSIICQKRESRDSAKIFFAYTITFHQMRVECWF
jgi:hypothetical protein